MNPNRTKHVAGTVIGVVLLSGAPIVARMLYVSGMHRAFVTLGSGPGIADPVRLSSDINAVLYACAGGFGGSLPRACHPHCFPRALPSRGTQTFHAQRHFDGLLLCLLRQLCCERRRCSAAHKGKFRVSEAPSSFETQVHSPLAGSSGRQCDASMPKPINSSEELKAVLATAPKTFHQGERFGDIVEFNGWFAASLDSPNTAPGKSAWIIGIVVQKGSGELCGFSHW